MHVGEDPLVVRQVRSRDELETAVALVHDNYVRCGYMPPHPSGIRIGVHYALPNTRTFVAVIRQEVVATLSLFVDSPLGLPLDALYGDEVSPLRASDRKLAEVGMLADRRRLLARSVEVLLNMMKLVFHAARHEGVDDLLITVNPKHAKFYQRLLCFEEVGLPRDYSAVGNAPAVLLRLGVSAIEPADAPNRRIRQLFFSPLARGGNDGAYRMQGTDLAYFFVRKSDVFRRLNDRQRQAIEQLYQSLDIPQMVAASASSAGSTA